MDCRITSEKSPGPEKSNAPEAFVRHPVLYRFGHQTVFPVFDSAFTKNITEKLGTAATFIFPVGERTASNAAESEEPTTFFSHSTCEQARLLSLHVEAMNRVFVISNIYAHPLVRKNEILNGHQIVSFAGTPIRNSRHRTIGTVCTVDSREREWTKAEIGALKEIAKSVEDCQL